MRTAGARENQIRNRACVIVFNNHRFSARDRPVNSGLEQNRGAPRCRPAKTVKYFKVLFVGVHQMKIQCLLRQNTYHTIAWMDPIDTELGAHVEIPGLGGIWEIIEMYPQQPIASSVRCCCESDPGGFSEYVSSVRH